MGSENKICFLFHSTHPRRVWLGRRKNKWYGKGVSIHTHTKDVTLIFMHDEDIVHVSIHTPTKGVTSDTEKNHLSLMFQSTHPRRVWHRIVAYTNMRPMFQSTHPRRVWLVYHDYFTLLNCFNPHTHEGCDLFCVQMDSTHASFNPHTHEGCD